MIPFFELVKRIAVIVPVREIRLTIVHEGGPGDAVRVYPDKVRPILAGKIARDDPNLGKTRPRAGVKLGGFPALSGGAGTRCAPKRSSYWVTWLLARWCTCNATRDKTR